MNKSMPSPDKKYKFSDYFYNGTTYVGAILALTVFAVECLLFGLDFLSKESNIYVGILTFVILPPFLIIGLILIPLGAFLKKRRVARGIGEVSDKKYHLDLTKATHRNALAIFLIGSVFIIVMTTIGSYKAYQYTESVAFCGLTCHKVMSPQHEAYLNSPHAKIKCIECHIGSGAGWYVHYKLAGVRMLYHFVKNDYRKPIPTPVEGLRPAKDICQECHWPEKFYSSVEVQKKYFPASEAENKDWNLRMLVNVGKTKDQNAGIHSHMYLNNEIYYAAEDKERQKITWVKSIAKDGTETVFVAPDSKFAQQPPDEKQIRKMDCLDCHNRPAHHFNPPYKLVDEAMARNVINPEIPEIKSKIMELLSGEYKTQDEAYSTIKEKLLSYYQTKQADYFKDHQKEIEQAADAAIAMFKHNFFPEMKTRWDNRPEQTGHLWTPGCFRCHDGAHTSKSGKTISKDCTICHTIIEQGPSGAVQSNISGLEFIHPFDNNELWKEMNCSDCHTGN